MSKNLHLSSRPPPSTSMDAMLLAAVDIVFLLDNNRRIIGVSQPAQRWLRISADMLIGHRLDAFLRFAPVVAAEVCETRCADGITTDTHLDPVSDIMQSPDVIHRDLELRALLGGRSVPVRAGFAAVTDSRGSVCGVVCSLTDHTEAVSNARALGMARAVDAVTGLCNREGFERLIERLDRSGIPPNRPYWVACIDLDQFRIVNDAAGHVAGDALLMQMANALRGHLRDSDLLARLGGDEFVLLVRPCERAEAQRLIDRLMETARQLGFSWKQTQFPSTVSVGIAPLSNVSEGPQHVLRLAERARYLAKESGRDHSCFATDDHPLQDRQRDIAAVSQILSALAENRFVLHGQDVATVDRPDRPVYREILARMVAADGSLIPPGQFIPGAERYFMMDAIDRWVVRTTIETLQLLPDDGVVHAVNLSGQSISDDRFRSWLLGTLRELPDLCPRLCVEVTETAAVRRMEIVKGFFGELSALGVRIALDDFGVGMSSFGYLADLPLHYLKIDGRFIRDIDKSPFFKQVVHSICDVGHAAGMVCIAEHVEDVAMLPKLQSMGVHLAQGWGIAREVPFGGGTAWPPSSVVANAC